MKNGSVYADRVRKAYLRLAKTHRKPNAASATDPLRQAAAAVLGRHDGLGSGTAALDRIFKRVVDWNEVRVSTAEELSTWVGGLLKHPRESCEDLIRMLNGVFRRENAMSLDRLMQGKVKDARKYLESLPGFDAYVTASVLLWSLGAHAIPVNDRLLERMRREGWVSPEAEREEVQGFLERHVKAQEAQTFAQVMESASLQRFSGPSRSGVAPAAKSAVKSKSKAKAKADGKPSSSSARSAPRVGRASKPRQAQARSKSSVRNKARK